MSDPTSVLDRASRLLAELAGPGAVLREDQAAAITGLVVDRQRLLVVQRTGWGKSAVYFIATRLRRDAGAGPTLLVSPLLALMRDQIANAGRIGLRAATVNSTNVDDWDAVYDAVTAGEVDLLCVSPERLNHPGFRSRVLGKLSAAAGLLVVDEAHCISDWGHDFRPDYRRVADAIAALDPGTPVLATTATANDRVVADIVEQLGATPVTLRGTLDRESLHLGVVATEDAAERLAWVAAAVARLEGSGIVYCLTVADTARVAAFLQSRGLESAAYSGDVEPAERERIEAAFAANELRCVVATSALGMGYDKADVAWVLHHGMPPSPVAYYQQVGRAGRALERATAVLLPGREDSAIWDWFAAVAFPPEPLVRRVLDTLGAAGGPMSLAALEPAVNLRRGRLESLLKILDVDGAVERVAGGWAVTGRPWAYDAERIARVDAARSSEADAMVAYAAHPGCRMAYLRAVLDDAGGDCGRCDRCLGRPVLAVEVDDELRRAAVQHLRGADVVLEPRKQWARGVPGRSGNIKARAETGRALCRANDAGWWPLVGPVLDGGELDDDLTDGILAVLRRWEWSARPRWITWIPSADGSGPAEAVARRIGDRGHLPVVDAVRRIRPGPAQSTRSNSAHQLANVAGAFAVEVSSVEPDRLAGPVLLVDDTWSSGWTMTEVAAVLRTAGAGAVLPFVLART